MDFKSEFYSNLSNYTKEEIDSAFKFLSSEEKTLAVRNWSVDSTKKINKPAYRVFKKISEIIESGVIYKKLIFNEFPMYSEEEVINKFNMLRSSNKRSLMKIYSFSKETKEVANKIDRSDKDSIRYGLKRMNEYLNGINPNMNFYIGEWYSLFTDYSKEEVDKAFSTLNDYYKGLVKKKYGEKLDGYFNNKLTKEEKYDVLFGLNRAMRNSLKKLKSGYKTFGIEDIFLGYKFDAIRMAIDKLEKGTKEFYYNRFGQDLRRRLFAKTLDNNIDGLVNISDKKKLLNVLEGCEKSMPVKDFYSRFLEYKKENESNEEFERRIKSVVESRPLNDRLMNILVKAFGSNYKETRGNISPRDKRIINSSIIPVIKSRLNPKSSLPNYFYKSFFDRFPIIFSKEEIINEILNLSLEELKYLRCKYGESFDKRLMYGEVYASDNEKIRIIRNKILRQLIKRKSDETGVSVETLKGICELVKKIKDFELVNEYGVDISVAVLINLYIEDINVEQIYKLTSISPKVFVSISQEYLEKVKEKEAKKILAKN